MSDIQRLTDAIIAFRDERGWDKNQSPKEWVLSLLIESAELGEHFQWKDGKDLENHLKANKVPISEELSDVLYHVLYIARNLDIDIIDAFEKKMKKNAKKYPAKKSSQ